MKLCCYNLKAGNSFCSICDKNSEDSYVSHVLLQQTHHGQSTLAVYLHGEVSAEEFCSHPVPAHLYPNVSELLEQQCRRKHAPVLSMTSKYLRAHKHAFTYNLTTSLKPMLIIIICHYIHMKTLHLEDWINTQEWLRNSSWWLYSDELVFHPHTREERIYTHIGCLNSLWYPILGERPGQTVPKHRLEGLQGCNITKLVFKVKMIGLK